MHYKLDDLTVLNDLRARMETVTPEMVEAHGRKGLKALSKTDKLVGNLDGFEVTKALYTVCRMLGHEVLRNKVQAETTLEKELADDFAQRQRIADELYDVANELLWAQIKTDLGLWGDADTVGLREGWLVVEVEERGGINPIELLIKGMRPPQE